MPAPGGYRLILQEGQFLGFYSRRPFNSVGVVATNTSVADGAWHNLAFVVDTNGGIIYVDGNLSGAHTWAGTWGPPTTTADLLIGNYAGNLGNSYEGFLDEVALWNVALTQSDIQSNLYRSFTGSEPGLLAYWRMDEGSGLLARDATRNH